MGRIVIVGGSGAFGFKLAERLAKSNAADLIVAGRNLERAEATVQKLQQAAPEARLVAAALDATASTPADVKRLAADILINASGPFQDHDYYLAETAIKAGCHYIDLADARDYVCGVVKLDEAAKAAGVTVVSGASSVPGLSSSVVADLSQDFADLEAIFIAISPGNHFDPGEATMRSVLSGLGKPIAQWRDGGWQMRFGWQDIRKFLIPGLGKRWLGNVDVPDLALFPDRYLSVKSVCFQAGLEVPVQHLGLWGLSWLSRAGILKRPENLAPMLRKLKSALSWLGSDEGGMVVSLSGKNHMGLPLEKVWTLIARSGHGPHVPILASAILAKDLLNSRLTERGAMACFNLISLARFEEEADGLDISFRISQR